MKWIFLFLTIGLGIIAVSIIPPVIATHIGGCPHNDLQCIADAFQEDAPFPEGTIVLTVEEAFQGTNSLPSSLGSQSFLEWKMIFQDGTDSGTTKRISSVFSPFRAFDPSTLFTFVPTEMPLRTLIEAQIINKVDYSNIGTDFCFTTPTTTINQQILVNGREVTIPKQLFGKNTLDRSTQILTGVGVKFFPALIETLLENKGIILKTGDQVVWKVTVNSRYDVWEGKIIDPSVFDQFSPVGSGTCGITGATAFDVNTVGMIVQMSFTWVDPFDLITIPTTTQPDLDGDGIPDSIDQCDFSPETFNGFQDEDGCPDPDPIGFVSDIQDMDGDGILDADDLCPTQPEIFNGIEDGDGCPEGAILAQNFQAFKVTGQELVPLTEQESAPLQPIPTAEEVIELVEPPTILISEPTPTEDIILIEENPQTQFQGIEEPVGNTGQTNFCNNLTDDCNQIFTQAVDNFEQLGIMLPFQPTILNIIIIIGIVVAVILIIMKLRGKI